MTVTDIEQARTLSLLTESPHLIVNDQKHVAFAGYVFTYSTFATVFMWAMCGQVIYKRIWAEQEGAVQSVKDLNPHDTRLQAMSDNNVGNYLTSQLTIAMSKMNPGDMEKMIEKMLEEVV